MIGPVERQMCTTRRRAHLPLLGKTRPTMDESDDAEEYEGEKDQGTEEELANESNGQSFTRGKVTWM